MKPEDIEIYIDTSVTAEKEVKRQLRKQLDMFRPDIELNDDYVNSTYNYLINNQEEYGKISVESASSIVNYYLTESGYFHSIFTFVDRVFYLDFQDLYYAFKNIGILTGEMVGITHYLEKKGITIDCIIDEPLSTMEKMEANDNEIQYYTENQLEKIINREIFERFVV